MSWVIGALDARGFEALRLSIQGALRLFGLEARYAIVVHSMPVYDAMRATGVLAPLVQWRLGDPPLRGERLASPRLFPDSHELLLEPSVILWSLPPAVTEWLGTPSGCLVAEDVRPRTDAFSGRVAPTPRHLALQGLPPRLDVEPLVRALCAEQSHTPKTERERRTVELTALLGLCPEPALVSVRDVTVCVPFPPGLPYLGRCGAHFPSLGVVNRGGSPPEAKALAESRFVAELWDRLRPEMEARLVAIPREHGLAG